LYTKHGMIWITLSGVKLRALYRRNSRREAPPQDCEADVAYVETSRWPLSTDALDKVIGLQQDTGNDLEYRARPRVQLVETLAYRIAREILQAFPASRARVKVRKRPASLLGRSTSSKLRWRSREAQRIGDSTGASDLFAGAFGNDWIRCNVSR